MGLNLELRPFTTCDIDSIAKYANNLNIEKWLRDGFPYPYTLDDAKNFIIPLVDMESPNIFAISLDGEAIGSIGVFFQENVYNKSAEIGYWLGEPFWGKSIMSSSIRFLTQYLFSQYDLVRLFSEPYSDNIGSRKALEKAGYIYEGTKKMSVYKHGAFHDSCIYAAIKNDWKEI